MKLIILRLNTTNKPSPMSEGVAEIRINNQPCKGINLTTQHAQARRAPRVATIQDEVKETIRAHLTLVHVFHVYASVDTPWVAHAPSHYTSVKRGKVPSNSATVAATKFVGPHKSCMQSAHNPSPRLSHLKMLHFSLVAPPGLILSHLSSTQILKSFHL